MERLLIPAVAGTLFVLGLAFMLAIAYLGTPGRDLGELARYLASAGLISLLCGTGGLLWLRQGRGRLWQQMALTTMLGIGLALFNIVATVQLMFIASSELPLLLLLVGFAGVISLGLGIVLALVVARRVTALNRGAQALAAGDLGTRVTVQGSDELAELAREFNGMAEQLATGAAERERQEHVRRELIAAVSHDLRTPLASIRAMLEAINDGLIDDPATHDRYLRTMRSQVDHMNVLINDLFELSRIDAGSLRLERRRVALAELLNEAVMGLQAQAQERRIALRTEVASDVPPVPADPQQIERVIFNLLANALRHSPAGSTVRLLVESCADQLDAPAARIAVIDQGEGIAPEDLPHIFDRFYRGDKSRSRATGGAGLGLAIARGIVEAHGGRIWVASRPGEGTSVFFTLPCETSPAATPE
jgi:signal transduction histidine kinase